MRTIFAFLILLGSWLTASAATAPIYINRTFLRDKPVIDATAFVNQARIQFNFDPFAGNGTLPLQSLEPFEFSNTRHFTNFGTFICDTGMLFRYRDDVGFYGRADTFVQDSTGTLSVPNNSFGTTSILLIDAKKVQIQGSVDSAPNNVIQISGENVDVSRAILNGNPAFGGFGTRTIFTNLTFIPDIGVFDQLWGAEQVQTDAAAIYSEIVQGNGDILRQVISPDHTVTNAGGGVFNGYSLGAQQPSSFVYTNKVNDTNFIVQAIFVQPPVEGISFSANFYNSPYPTVPTKTASVTFSTVTTNPITRAIETRQATIVDYLASDTNYTTVSNLVSALPTYRPAAFELWRTRPNIRGGGTRVPTNATPFAKMFTHFFGGEVTNADGAAYTNLISTNVYASYSAYMTDGAAGTTPIRPDQNSLDWQAIYQNSVTNTSGRIAIGGENLNLSRTRIQADGAVLIRAKHLESTEGAQLVAPYITYNLGSTNRPLKLESLAAKDIDRLFGTINAFSTVWTNAYELTKTNAPPPPAEGEEPGEGEVEVIRYETVFHVLIVNSDLQTKFSTEVNELVATSKATDVNDILRVGDKLEIQSTDLTVNNQLVVGDRIYDVTAREFPNLLYLTNRGVIRLHGSLTLGPDRGDSLKRLQNFGTNIAAGHYYKVDEFINQGLVQVGFHFDANQRIGVFPLVGEVDINADSTTLSAGQILTEGGIVLTGRTLKARQHTAVTKGRITLTFTESMADTGTDAGNRFEAGNGFSVMTKPRTGDLLGTVFQSNLGADGLSSHLWPGEDRGAKAAGFKDNLAIGTLRLTAQAGAKFQFAGTSGRNGMYVDYLEISPTIIANLESMLSIDPSLTIYFANANVAPESLDGALGGRLKWVSDYAGSSSSVSVRLPNGQVIRVSKGYRNSSTVDTDGDGIANINDLTPFDGAIFTGVRLENRPPLTAVVRWSAAAQTTYVVEASPVIRGGSWTPIKTIRNESNKTEILTIEEAVPSGAGSRYYRVRYNPLETIPGQQ